MKWEIILGSFFTALGVAEEFLSQSGESRTFLASLQIEASLLSTVGLALFVKVLFQVRRQLRQKLGLLVVLIPLILVATSLVYILGSSAIINVTAASEPSPLAGIKPVVVKVAGGPIAQGSDYYVPERVTLVIGVNNTIIWQNVDASHHTVTEVNRLFESGNINPNQSYTRSFTRPGAYSYVCDYHPWMKGTVIVRG